MNMTQLGQMLEGVAAGKLSVDNALSALRRLEISDLGFARIDHHREVRCGLPEVVYGAGKTAEQIIGIVRDFRERGNNALVTRVRPEAAESLTVALPEAEYDVAANTLMSLVHPPDTRPGFVGIVVAGTSDQPVAMEAVNTLRFFGIATELLMDVGVAGLHRLLAKQERLHRYDVAIVVAGMEGALPSVVGGLIGAPVIAVPTSVGYGAHLQGLAALLSMLNSCASGITVTNIDNGYGAACAAARMLRLLQSASGAESSAADAVGDSGHSRS